MNSFDDVKARWQSLFQGPNSIKVVVEGTERENFVEKWWTKMLELSLQKDRAYHTLQHIRNLIALFDEYKSEINNPKNVLLAIFFHDIIYDPKSKVNEDQSMETFQEFASGTDLSSAERDLISMYIMETKYHTQFALGSKYDDSDLCYFLDFDISILGASEDEYKKYSQQIRSEYSFFPVDQFSKGRKQFLIQMLEKITKPEGFLFRTLKLRERFQNQAIKNLRAEAESL